MENRVSPKLGAIVMSLLVLSGWVGGDEDEVSAEILAREAEYPVMSDVEISSGERTRLWRSEGSRALSYVTPGAHVQRFEPNEGSTLADVAAELVALAEQAGFVVEERFEEIEWCGVDGRTPEKRSLSIYVSASPPVPDLAPHVSLEIDRSC